MTREEISAGFPVEVVHMVDGCSERKWDSAGNSIPWKLRKAEHLAHVNQAPLGRRAILPAEKLHNFSIMVFDQAAGISISDDFNATREDVAWYLTTIVEAASDFPDDRLKRVAIECRHRHGELATGG